jgi:hypothetical protein
MKRIVPNVLVFLILAMSATFLVGDSVTPVVASPGGIIWAKSEQVGTHDQQANGVAVDSSGVYVVGSDANLTSLYYEWRLEKRDLTSGTSIWSFSEHISPVYGNDAAMAVAVDSSGVYIVGYDSASNNGHFEWRIEKRDLSTGAFISGFGSGGAVSEHISNRDDVAYGVAIDTTGLYIVGYDENTAGNIPEWRIEKRDLNTGALTWSVSEPISTASNGDIALGVAVDGSGVYVVGYDTNTGCGNLSASSEWRIEKRDLTTGGLIGTFGSSGAISEHISSMCDQATAAAVDSTGLYIVGFDQNTSGNWDEWRIEKRDLTSGAFITTFGSSGAVVEHVSPYRDDAYAARVDASGLYVVGKDENSTSYPEWRMEKRNLSSGAAIWTVSEDIGTGSPGNQAYGVAVDQTGVYVAGEDSAAGNGFGEWRIEKRILGDQTLITQVTSGSGTVNPNCPGPTGCSEDVGSSISVTATPSSGWTFSSWTISGASCSGGVSTSPCQFTMPNNAVTVSATFTSSGQVTMTVSYSIVGGGNPKAPVFHYILKGAKKSLTLTTTPKGVSVDTGSAWSVTPNPLSGSSLTQRWYSTQPLSGTASSTTIVFTFQHQYYLTMKTSGPGTVTPSSGWQNAAAKVTITATANTGHKFKSWKGSGSGSFSGTTNPASVTMNAAITETATFT